MKQIKEKDCDKMMDILVSMKEKQLLVLIAGLLVGREISAGTPIPMIEEMIQEVKEHTEGQP